jgi:AAA ATPase domain
MRNPFKPTFGVTPPLLVGRGETLKVFDEGLEDGPGSPARATLYTGARGVGKTVMLNAVQDLARARGWLVIAETATPGFFTRIVNQHLPQLLSEFDPAAQKTRLTGVTAPLQIGGATWDTTQTHSPTPGFRNQVSQLTDLLADQGTGLLITLDEIHRRHPGELREFAAEVQHAFREDRELAFAGAGLPSSISDVLNDEVVTFLRRADRHSLGAVAISPDVAQAIQEPTRKAGRDISDESCLVAANATGGYPFLIQLVGYHIWRQHPSAPVITSDDVNAGAVDARRRLGALVHEPSLAETSEVGRTFLVAMSQDDGPSTMADVASRLGVDANYASQYRIRLLEAELIRSAGHGKVDFVVPYLREYLREHAAAMP